MGLGTKIKDALSIEHEAHPPETPHPPGSYPEDKVGGKHSDGREHVAPHGTAVDNTGAAAAGTSTHNKLHKAEDPRSLEGPHHAHTRPQEEGILSEKGPVGHRHQDSGVDVGRERVPGKAGFAGHQAGPGGAATGRDPYWGDVGAVSGGRHPGAGLGSGEDRHPGAGAGAAGAGAAGAGASGLGPHGEREELGHGAGAGGLGASNLASRDLPDRTRGAEQDTLGRGPMGTTGATTGFNDPEGTHGPHSSRVANAADPRVDSDRDHRGAHHGTAAGVGAGAAAAGAGYAAHEHHNNRRENEPLGQHTTTTTTTGYNDPEGTHGPHSSRAANAADPRVDSDRDHRGAHHHTAAGVGAGAAAAGAGYAAHEHHNNRREHEQLGHNTAGTTTRNTATGYNDPEGTHGPHSSRAANAADPRVDSDRDHRGAHHHAGVGTGAATAGAGAAYAAHEHHNNNNRREYEQNVAGARGPTTGYNDPEGTHGPHSSRVANAADPRVDSDRDHRGAHHAGAGVGAGAAAAGASGLAAHEHNRRHEHGGLGQSGTTTGIPSAGQAVGGGTYNTVTGAGSPEDPIRRSLEGREGGREFPLSGGNSMGGATAGSGVTGAHHAGSGMTGSNVGGTTTTGGPSTSTTGGPTTSGAATSLLSGNNRGTTSPESSMSSAAARDTNYHPKMGTSDIAPTSRDDTARPVFSSEDAGLVGAGAGLGAAGAAAHHHHNNKHHQGVEYGATSGGAVPPGAPRGSMLDPYSSTTESSTTRGMNEPGMTGSSNLPHSSTATGQHGNLAARDLGESTTGAHTRESGLTSGAHSGGLTGGSGGLGHTSGGNTAGGYAGPAYEGAKVMHKCAHCGNDNDISHYFKKDAVYRING